MKRLLLICFVLMLSSCNKKTDEQKISQIDSAIIKLPDTAYVSVNKVFLDHFKNAAFDTMTFLPPKNAPADVSSFSDNFNGIFANYLKTNNPEKPSVYPILKFPLDKKITALITQNPGENGENSTSILLYNHNSEGITDMFPLADEIKESGFSAYRKTVLIKTDNTVKGLQEYRTSVFPAAADDPTNPVESDEFYWLYFNKDKIDTVKIPAKEAKLYRNYFNNKLQR